MYLLNDSPGFGMLQQMLADLIQTLPKIVLALVILIIGWILAKLVAGIFRKLIVKTPLDAAAEKLNAIDLVQKTNIKIVPSTVLSKILYYIILLFSIVAAADVLNMDAISNLITNIIGFIPRIIVAGIVLMIGVFIADFIKDIITTVCQSLGIPSAKMIGGFVFWFIFLTALVSAMGQAGIETDFIMSNLSLLLAGGVFAFALGYGIASRDMMANFLASFYSKDKVSIGDKITLDGVTGEVIDMDNNSLTLQTQDRRIFIPLKKLSTENLEIHNE